jgi:acetyl-CoA synthetase
VGQPHEIKGTSIAAFVMLNAGQEEFDTSVKELKNLVRPDIGSFALPDMIIVAPSLPMTRSGKIMRRILRKIVCGEADSLGDTSTLADPSIVDIIIEKVAAYNKN